MIINRFFESEILQDRMNKILVLGLDVGGTHVTSALIDISQKKVVKNSGIRRLLDSTGSLEEIIAVLHEVIRLSVIDMPLSEIKIGIAIPGPFDYEMGICLISEQQKFGSLYKQDVRKALADKLDIDAENIKFCNDAACYLNGEVVGGVAVGYKKVLGLTLGTGLGAAIAEGGKVLDADLWSSPFRKGIAEDFISSRWILDHYTSKTGETKASVKELAEAAVVDKVALQVFEALGKNIGEFLVQQLAGKDFEMVVLGGNIANAFDLFIMPLKDLLAESAIDVEVKKTVLGEHASILGAAALWMEADVPVDRTDF